MLDPVKYFGSSITERCRFSTPATGNVVYLPPSPVPRTGGSHNPSRPARDGEAQSAVIVAFRRQTVPGDVAVAHD
jgi:hypothetical protein